MSSSWKRENFSPARFVFSAANWTQNSHRRSNFAILKPFCVKHLLLFRGEGEVHTEMISPAIFSVGRDGPGHGCARFAYFSLQFKFRLSTRFFEAVLCFWRWRVCASHWQTFAGANTFTIGLDNLLHLMYQSPANANKLSLREFIKHSSSDHRAPRLALVGAVH